MRVGLRILKPKTVRWLREQLLAGALCRSELARGLCRIDGWANPKGELCSASARAALPRLAAGLGLPLPTALDGPSPIRDRSAAPPELPPGVGFSGSLRDLRPVSLVLARSRSQRRRCNDLLAAAHPLGRSRAPGARLTYLLVADRAGPLGVLTFVAAPLRSKPRDDHIGWDQHTRARRIRRVLANDRFLLLPGVQVRNLASHALALAARRLPADWRQLHAIRPLLLETCVGPEHRGTSYHAAGWRRVGQTSGRPPGSAAPVPPKAVWLRGLRPGWRQALAKPWRAALGSFPALDLPREANWSEREFGRCDLPDGRLRRRLQRMALAFERNPGQPLPDIFPRRAELVAAYRFLHNDGVDPADILQPHREAMVERCRLHATVLLVQDTTSLNYTSMREVTRGLGPLKQRSNAARGLWVHATVAFTAGRRPLGVSGLETWARPEVKPADEAEKESRRWLRGFAQGRELGRACPGTRVVVVGDRESDIYELLELQAAHAGRAGLLVRVHAGRQRRARLAEGQPGPRPVRALPTLMRDVPAVRTGHAVRIGSRGGPKARARRVARTELRVARVEVQPPKERPRSRPLEAWAVQVLEPSPPAGSKALHWLLLSSDGGPTAAAAEQVVRWYEARWGIEELFRVLKSGTRIEDRQLQSADSLEKCLALDAVAAWRVFALDRCARDAPDLPPEQVFTADEIRCIWLFNKLRQLRPDAVRGSAPPADARGMVLAMAHMAGWYPSKRRPMPGNEVLWRANRKLQPMVETLQGLRREGWLALPDTENPAST